MGGGLCGWGGGEGLASNCTTIYPQFVRVRVREGMKVMLT